MENNISSRHLQSMESLQNIAESQQINKSEYKEQEPRQVAFCQLFRFATNFDYVLMTIGSIAALAVGTAYPAFAYIWGNMTDSFQTNQTMVSSAKSAMFIYIYVGLGGFLAGWLMFACWMITSQRQAIACRKAYLQSLLSQQIGWFDIINQTQLSTKFASDTFMFQGAIGQKISTLIMTIATLSAGYIFAFVTGWLMTLVMFASIPAFGIAGYFYIKVFGQKDKQKQKSYIEAGGRVQQAFSAIKTVKQLNGEQFECIEYQKCLQKASQKSIKYALFCALGIAGIYFVQMITYSLGYWYGSQCILRTQNCSQSISHQNYTAGKVLTVYFCVVFGGFQLSQFSPALKKISEGRKAASRIFSIIDRQPTIKNPPNGVKIDNFKGKIVFENVTFSYPKDKSRKVLDNLNMEFDINKTGLVGQSGCGKSTTLQLIMRFYDPDQGRITIDGHDIRTIDLIWWRQQIGYVGQQPVLFATSIKQNLLIGNQKATDQEINQALKMAEAYDFVQSLEQKLQTFVGYGGGQLSGGQKQRIAIARAILRKPKIMMLDEATSALDRRNERLIQSTLQKVTSGITTITVAHSIKTIMHSNMIYVFQKGGIAERGKFNQLNMFKNYKQEQDIQNNNQLKPTQEIKILFNEQQGNDKEVKKLQQDLKMKKQQKEKAAQKLLVDKYNKVIFRRIFSYSKDKRVIFIFGIIAALALGVIYPVFSIFLSKIFSSLLIITTDHNNQTQIEKINLYCIIFMILAFCCLIIYTIQTTFFDLVGDHITKKIRMQSFYKILRMPVPWFDDPKNNAGILSSRLSRDCYLVNNVTTTTISILIQNLSSLLAGIIIAFVHQWRTSLVALGFLPLIILNGAIQMALTTGFSDQTDEAYNESSNLIMETMINIRTVTSFGYQRIIVNKYSQKMQKPYRLAVKKGNTSGFFFGFGQCLIFFIFGIIFYLGALFIRDNPEAVTVQNMFTAIYAIMFAGRSIGNNALLLPDAAACKSSAANLFEILDSQDQDQMQIQQNSKLLKSNASGDIVLTDVDFKYDSRNEYVFKNMNLKVKKGNKVAFVGSSGCGKSTIIQLLQRFYNPTKGTITINGIDIKDYDIHYLRSCFGVVSQEPVLFNGSFADNIRYNKTQATMTEIQSAAHKANAISFIMGSQETNQQLVQNSKQNKTGFDRSVGVRGSHISGGQKQRVAIARTILRNPQMLLLDQATSALDRNNEIKVQDSLDSIMKGKTVISVAHRIQTIKNSDQILMFEKGKIVQSGTYAELMAKQCYFYNLEKGTSFT